MIFCWCTERARPFLCVLTDTVQIYLPGRERLKIAPCTIAEARFYWSSFGNLTDKPPGLGLTGEKVQCSGAAESVQCACWHSCLMWCGRAYETFVAPGLLKWRNRAAMDRFFCSQMFSVSLKF